jgi:uncharacterized membrane protein
MTLEHTDTWNQSFLNDEDRGRGQPSRALSMRNNAVFQAHEAGGGLSQNLTPALGWLSLGLGASALLYPSKLAEVLGLRVSPSTQSTIRGVGLREIISGIGILTQQSNPIWLWSRVLGDAMDLTLLNKAMNSQHLRNQGAVINAQAAVAGITAMDVFASMRVSSKPGDQWSDGKGTFDGQIPIEGKPTSAEPVVASTTINREPDEVYEFWRNFENFPRFMEHLDSVQVTGDRRSHWRALGPANKAVEWDAEIVEDRPGEMISWRSLENADVSNAGKVVFHHAPGGRGTEVRVEMSYQPPAGVVGRKIASLLGREPGQEVHSDLRRLKSVLDVGEVIRSDATLSGHALSLKQRSAKPPEQAPQLSEAMS